MHNIQKRLWSRDLEESHNIQKWMGLPSHRHCYGPLSVPDYMLGGIICLTWYIHSWALMLEKWWYLHTPSKYKVTMASETILCRNKIKSVIMTHVYIRSKRVFSLWISQLSSCQCYSPRLGPNFWFKLLRFAIMEENLVWGFTLPFTAQPRWMSVHLHTSSCSSL